MHDLKQSQSSESSQLHSLMVDPAVNIMFSSMKKQLKQYKEKLEHAQNDLSAWKFTPDRLEDETCLSLLISPPPPPPPPLSLSLSQCDWEEDDGKMSIFNTRKQ